MKIIFILKNMNESSGFLKGVFKANISFLNKKIKY